MTLQPDLETVRKALLLRRPDDAEYTHAAHMALAAFARLEQKLSTETTNEEVAA